MIAYFILGLCLLVGFILLARWFVAADPKKVISLLRWVLAGVGLLAAGYLLWGGARGLALLAILFLLPLAMNARAIRNRIKSAQGPSAGQRSEVNTRIITMTLDHDSGEMDGLVNEGRFQGRQLAEMNQDDLIELWRECRATDAQSAAVLETYLDRTQGEEWRSVAGAGAGPESGGGDGALTRDEAYAILGLESGASKEDIHEAHRRLMQKIHPDHGGSNYLAAKINQAKALLLGE